MRVKEKEPIPGELNKDTKDTGASGESARGVGAEGGGRDLEKTREEIMSMPRSQSSAGKRPMDGEKAGVPICATIEPGTLIGDYRVIKKLDEGGMGAVYEGIHPVIGKRVAIKLLHPHVARQEVSVARFIQEARAVNAIGHREIVDVFGFGKFSDGRQYIVMEFLEGCHLLSFLNENGPLEPLKACFLVRLIAGALEAAHAKGVIHRDLKPENVFLISTKGISWPPVMKLLDFGLAKLIEDKFKEGPQTRMGATVGTPYYMAPEQCRGRNVDARTDVYALGVMFYEMITGRVPFFAEQPVDVLYMHLTKDPDPPSMWTDIPQEIEDLIMACMSKPPELRPAGMNTVIAKIEEIEQRLTEEEAQDSSSFADLLATTAGLLGRSDADNDEDNEDNDENNYEDDDEVNDEADDEDNDEVYDTSYSLGRLGLEEGVGKGKNTEEGFGKRDKTEKGTSEPPQKEATSEIGDPAQRELVDLKDEDKKQGREKTERISLSTEAAVPAKAKQSKAEGTTFSRQWFIYGVLVGVVIGTALGFFLRQLF